MIKVYLKAIGMLVGMIFGAGVFALPYSFMKAGIFWGIVYFSVALSLMILLHYWYGEVAYFTEGKHRFIGYVEIFFNKKTKWFSFLITLFTNYGALFAYGFLGGIFLSNIFSISPFLLSILVFCAGSFMIFFKPAFIASVNFYLSILLFGLVAYLFYAAIPNLKLINFLGDKISFSLTGDWFLPYGIWVFALAGFAALPEARDIIGSLPVKNFKKVILISLVLCAIFYLIFVATVLGVAGKNTTEDALGSLANLLGESTIAIGSILGFLAVFTSFIALGADLKNIFRYDFKFPPVFAWLSVAVPPVMIFFAGTKNFIKVMGIAGSIGLGLMGILIILMRKKLFEKMGESNGSFLFLSWIVGGLVALGIIAEVISEL